jgi:hypothetical protein
MHKLDLGIDDRIDNVVKFYRTRYDIINRELPSMEDTEIKNRLYTTQQAADMLDITDGRLRQLIKAGKVKPDQKIGGIWLFTIDEIERLLGRKRTPGRAKKQS